MVRVLPLLLQHTCLCLGCSLAPRPSAFYEHTLSDRRAAVAAAASVTVLVSAAAAISVHFLVSFSFFQFLPIADHFH